MKDCCRTIQAFLADLHRRVVEELGERDYLLSGICPTCGERVNGRSEDPRVQQLRSLLGPDVVR